MQLADRITGVLTIVFGSWVTYLSIDLGIKRGGVPGPGLLPMLCGVLLIGFGLSVLLKPAAAGVPANLPKIDDGVRVLVVAVVMAVYTGLIPTFGFPVTTSVLLAGMIWWWGSYRLWLSVLVGVVLALLMTLVFQVLLGAPLPEGMWS